MGLKHECPAPAKFGSAEPLWKTATTCFLKTVHTALNSMAQLESRKFFLSSWRPWHSRTRNLLQSPRL